MSKPKDVIVACDFPSRAETLAFLDRFGSKKPFVKIGMELFYSEGASIVREIKDRGHKIFLDLKLHDIPNTVERAMRRLSDMGVDMTNVHVAGGRAMMEAAQRGLRSMGGQEPILLGVTQLTSTSKEQLRDELLIDLPMEEVVLRYARLAQEAGLNGVVSSPLESPKIHQVLGEEFLTVTPGIRYPDGDEGDQKRIASPERARSLGSDYIVVGRPITAAPDPEAAYRRVCQDFLGLK